MKKKPSKKQAQVFDGLDFPVTLPRRDYRRMSARQLHREGRLMYAGLQVAWRVEINMTSPNWPMLESISHQLSLFEARCPEVCQP